ncbi:hypothetical protein [Azospirillum doebereinerae]|uniref:hypothetical protein n=1 Tax=Azospirillum doebereinerae TaxID=92933 RepID=UPI001EE63306|nr:hypothetical protein [Azospirillum doebereinerae]MCG5240630.1 hypothetical protein [Azospirillum doebereinerae]
MGRDALRLRHPALPTTAEDIIAHCRTNPARYKAPRSVVFGDLPKIDTGKIQKNPMRRSLE